MQRCGISCLNKFRKDFEAYATDFIGMFWTRLKELGNEEFEACSGQEKVGQLVDRLKPLGSKYAEELVAPLDAAFKANIFSHKHLRDM